MNAELARRSPDRCARSSPRDAKLIASTFRELGFATVTLAPDLTRDKFFASLHEFGLEAEKAEWAVVYYAGHGMEIGGVKPPEGLYGRSILPLLKTDKEGQIDPERTWVITGRERHVATAREDNLPYPMRALRTCRSGRPSRASLRKVSFRRGLPRAASPRGAAIDRGARRRSSPRFWDRSSPASRSDA